MLIHAYAHIFYAFHNIEVIRNDNCSKPIFYSSNHFHVQIKMLMLMYHAIFSTHTKNELNYHLYVIHSSSHSSNAVCIFSWLKFATSYTLSVFRSLFGYQKCGSSKSENPCNTLENANHFEMSWNPIPNSQHVMVKSIGAANQVLTFMID